MKIQCEISPEAIKAIQLLADAGLKAHEPNVNRTDILVQLQELPKPMLEVLASDMQRIKTDNGL